MARVLTVELYAQSNQKLKVCDKIDPDVILIKQCKDTAGFIITQFV